MNISLSKYFLKARGFTIIELLIVIAIIGILTAIVVSNFSGPKSKARDAKRISDLGTIQLAVSLYFDRCKQFPSAITNPTSSIVCPSNNTVDLGDYISTVPTAPAPGSYVYDVNSAKTDYILQATLESYNDILKDDVDGSVVLTATTDCGTANNGQATAERSYCLGSK
jgi:prepilin-type N-terminal cleavage/methylation domain-containing protein